MKSDTEIATQFKKHRQSTQRGLAKQYANTKSMAAFYAGDFMDYKQPIQFSTLAGQRKKALVCFNEVKPYVNAVKGFAAQNRRRAKYSARVQAEPLQYQYSTYANAYSDYLLDQANADQVKTQQDGDMLIAGYGGVETALTYGEGHATRDPNGEMLMGRLDPLNVGWDPFAKQSNLLDARWVFYDKTYDLDEAKDLFDASSDDFEQADDDEVTQDSGYEWYARGGRYNKIKEGPFDWADEKANLVKVSFYQWMEFETFYRADNPIYTLKNPQAIQLAAMQLDVIAQELNKPENEDMFTFDPRAEILNFNDKIKARLLQHFGKFITCYPFKRKVFYTAVLSGKHVFTKFRNQCQQGFTIKFKTGDYDAKNKIWTGMVNTMKDPVLYFNKALTELMFIIGANSKGGVMYEKGSIEDIQDFEAKYAKTDAAVEVAEGALAEGRIKPKREPYNPSGYEEILQIASDSIVRVNGIDKSFLGSSENKDETGILQKRRIKQVVSLLACYFDSITLFEKEHARMVLDFMKILAANNDGGLFRILGQNGKEAFAKIAADKFVAEYDVVITEAPQSPEDKQEFANVITQVGDKLAAVGDVTTAKAIYAIGMKYLPLDQEDLQHLIQILMPQDQQIDPAYVQQLEQQLQALMSEVTQADVKEKMSTMLLNLAKVGETKAKTFKTQQEGMQTGIENRVIARGVSAHI